METNAPTVMKFGGTSVGDVAAFERVSHVVSTQIDRRPVIVVSAMTKVTDALLAAFDIAKKGDAETAFDSLAGHFERHLAVSRHYLRSQPNPVTRELDLARDELHDLLVRASR
ncbi:MAG TPA: hypothetical protein VNA17_00760, partial [Pyrinomonadaceae bacterium]|nr:hypothetical protein [Pyrinomonadaceae bacterium]